MSNRSDAARGDRPYLRTDHRSSRAGDPRRIELRPLARCDDTDTQLEALANEVWARTELSLHSKRIGALAGRTITERQPEYERQADHEETDRGKNGSGTNASEH